MHACERICSRHTQRLRARAFSPPFSRLGQRILQHKHSQLFSYLTGKKMMSQILCRAHAPTIDGPTHEDSHTHTRSLTALERRFRLVRATEVREQAARAPTRQRRARRRRRSYTPSRTTHRRHHRRSRARTAEQRRLNKHSHNNHNSRVHNRSDTRDRHSTSHEQLYESVAPGVIHTFAGVYARP